MDLQSIGIEAAAKFLIRRGFDIVEKNDQCNDGNVIDIVAKDDGDIVFVKIRTFNIAEGENFSDMLVTNKERSKLESMAAWYLSNHNDVDVLVRFDIIEVGVLDNDRAMIRHVINALG